MKELQTLNLGSLDIVIAQEGNTVLYTFRGHVDDHFDYRLVPVMPKGEVTFNVSKVDVFNSCGTREWIYLLRAFPKTSVLSLIECSVVMYDQFNIVPQLFERVDIKSFYAPYYCPKCDEEVACLIETAIHLPQIKMGEAPKFQHHCKTMLEFDALEECYFSNFQK